MSELRPVWGLVLTGGKSRRMGSDKALLVKDGQTQLERSVALLERHLDRVFVSARADQRDDEARAGFPQVIDRFTDMGPVAGILSALAEYPDVDWLVLACDLPNVDDRTIATLLEQRRDDEVFLAYRSSSDGLPEPLCAIYAAHSQGVVRVYVDDGIHCPRKILIRSEARLLEQPHPDALDNVNTPADLAGSGAEIVAP